MNEDYTYAKLKNIPVFLVGRTYKVPIIHPGIHEVCYNVIFENGYTASVVKFNNRTVAIKDWELAVIDKDGHLDYSTPVTSDVERGDEDRINELLTQISLLPECK